MTKGEETMSVQLEVQTGASVTTEQSFQYFLNVPTQPPGHPHW